jgi:hypothetical protein
MTAENSDSNKLAVSGRFDGGESVPYDETFTGGENPESQRSQRNTEKCSFRFSLCAPL